MGRAELERKALSMGVRRRITAAEAVEENKKLATAMGAAMAKRIGMERKRNLWHFGALWLAVLLGTVLGVVL